MKIHKKGFINNKQGFTLVELIVVMVIIAILAAAIVWALTGYIKKAKESRLIVACRACVVAAQTIVSENHSHDTVFPPSNKAVNQ